MRIRDIALGVFAVAFAVVCVRLGLWQLDRRSQRRAANAEILARLEAAPLSPSAVPREPGAGRYRRVVLRGIYDFSHEIVLANRSRDGSPGVNLLTPLRMEGADTAILVNRGWVYSPDADTVQAGRWREAEQLDGGGYVAEFAVPDTAQGVEVSSTGALHRPELAGAAARVPYPLAPFYVVLADTTTPGSLSPVRIPPPPLDDGPHLNYAIQWFTFATIGLVGVGTILWGRRSATPRA